MNYQGSQSRSPHSPEKNGPYASGRNDTYSPVRNGTPGPRKSPDLRKSPGDRKSLGNRLTRMALTGGLLALLAGGSAGMAMFGNARATSLSAPAPAAAKPAASAVAIPGTGSATSASGSASTASKPGMPPAVLGSNWKVTFKAGFTGNKLDTSIWGTCYPWESQSGCFNFGNSAFEYQWYTRSQDQVSDGALHLVPERTPTAGTGSDGAPKQYAYRSGIVTTFPGYKFQYGYVQVVARVPDANGTWTALWLAASNEQWPPEIDILEHWAKENKYYEYYHPAGAARENGVQNLGNLSTGYHAYSVYWSATKIIWFIDGRQVFETMRNVPRLSMYFLANVAIDKQNVSFGPSSSLDIKSVTVWQRR